MKKARPPVRPMRLLLHVHSILNVHGHLNAFEISTKLQQRGVPFYVEMLHSVLHSVAAEYFGIRQVRGSNDFMILPMKLREVPTQPVPPPPPKKEEPIVKIDTPEYQTMRKAVMDFCVTYGRIPRVSNGKNELALYTFMNSNRQDKEFQAFVGKYKKRKGRPRDNNVAFKLAESGGTGF